MKLIGCMPLYDEEKESCWMLPAYMDMLREQGAVPVMLPLTDDLELLDQYLELCGGFLLTGGQDISPSLYGELPGPACGALCPVRDRMDSYIFKEAVRLNKPVLGICRGLQIMNVCLGGTLYQDLETGHPGGIPHHMTPPYDRTVHTVSIQPDTLLSRILGHREIGVNSYHHQAVREPAPSLKVAAVSEDGLIEAMYLPGTNYALGVQWHPEFSHRTDTFSARIARSFVGAVQNQ